MKAAVRPKVFLLVPTLMPNDAVGNDVVGMYRILSAAGYETQIFAEHIHHVYSSITRKAEKGLDVWRDPDALMIYHHAILWELGEEILAQTKNRVVIKYHNVTPPEFFANYAQHYYWACVKGKEATARLATLPGALVWGDSQYNADEFIGLGVDARRCRVVAPVHKIEDLAREPFDNVVLGAYRGGPANILFVGGMRPNKGHIKAMEVMAALRSQTSVSARLLLVGSFDPNLSRYIEDLQQYVKYLDLGEEVVFAHSVTPSQLRSYYMTASAFICVSEHEGFCVPLVEAMAFRVPVVAWATTAVTETAGGCGLVYDRFEPSEMAEGIASCLEDTENARILAERGRRRYEDVFHIDAIGRRLLELTEEAARI